MPTSIICKHKNTCPFLAARENWQWTGLLFTVQQNSFQVAGSLEQKTTMHGWRHESIKSRPNGPIQSWDSKLQVSYISKDLDCRGGRYAYWSIGWWVDQMSHLVTSQGLPGCPQLTAVGTGQPGFNSWTQISQPSKAQECIDCWICNANATEEFKVQGI